MRKEWDQIDFVLEDCPIHGCRITQIPPRTSYGINRNIYSKFEQPMIFPYQRNLIHSVSNGEFIEPNRDNYYYMKNCNNNIISQEENNNPKDFYNSTGFASNRDKEFTNNYSFYLSGTSRLKPRVTINNSLNQYNSQIIDNNNLQQRYNFIIPSYNIHNNSVRNNISNSCNIKGNIFSNRNNRNNKAIQYNNNRNRNDFINPESKRYKDEQIIIRTESEEINEPNNYYKKRKDYYLTPNYYNNNNKDFILDNKNYYINRNINSPIRKSNDNIYERIFSEGNNFKNVYKNSNNYYTNKENKINKREINNQKKNNENSIYKKKSQRNNNNYYKNYNYKEINSIKEATKIINTMKDNSFIDKSFNKLRDNEEKNENDKIKVKITNLNNHKFFISNNKIINTNRKISQKPNKINNYIIENVNKDIQIEKDLNNKKYIKNDYKKKYNNYNSNNVNRNQKNYSMQLIKDKKNDYLNKEIKGKYKNNKKEIEEINEGNKTTNDKDENVEQHIEKYYDSHGNFIGGKNVIVKKKYKDNGEKVIREVIKEEYKSNFNNLFKKFIPKKEEDGKYIQEEQEKYFPYQFNCEKLKKTDENNNINETDNNIKPNSYKNFEEQIKESKLEKNEEEENKNRIVTFGIKSDNLRFEIEDKDEKEADEQQIMINSEFEEEEENNIIKNNNTDKKEIIKSENISNKNDESNENNINDNKNVNKDNEFEDNNIDIIEKDNENK